MSPNTLEQLRSLDKSSPTFHDQFSDILCGEEYERWVPNLAGEDLVRLIGYLDKVCHRTTIPRSPLRPDRLSIVSILQVPVSGNVYANLGTYAAPR